MNKKKIRAAVIGLGVGAHQARTLSLNPNVELALLCDIDEKRRRFSCSDYESKSAWEHWDIHIYHNCGKFGHFVIWGVGGGD